MDEISGREEPEGVRRNGRERGIHCTMKRLVKTNIAAGKSLEEIAEFLGIDLSEVRALADEAN